METNTNSGQRRGRPPKTEEFAITHPHAFQETLAEFEARIAHLEPGDWIETSPEVIASVFKRGLAGKLYGMYRNALVCKVGDYEKIERESKTDVDDLFFPGSGKLD